ncbi:hypothetical protein VTN00DRAFT_3453 [Thermoascus crustaceus]|uniref:uncharacterized protein n=1 Tax=Thermoascus crustaceus TaxID=5088 RepID=UPI003741EF98
MGYLRGAGILVISGSVDGKTTNEEELNDWWTNEHLPERLGIPGFLHARRYYAPGDPSSSASAKYLTCYEVSSLDTLTSVEYMAALNAPTPRTQQFMPTLASMNRSSCTILYSSARSEFAGRLGGGVGATAALVTFAPPPDPQACDKLRSWILDALLPVVFDYPLVLAFHLLERNDAASRAGNLSKSYEAVRFQASSNPVAAETQGQWIMLVEFAESLSAPFAKHQDIVGSVIAPQLFAYAGVSQVGWQVYELVCAVSE